MTQLLLAADGDGRGLLGWLIFLAIGGLCGWVASIFMKTDAQMGLVANVVVGIVGAVLAGWLLPMLGLHFGGGFLGGILLAIVGAVILLFVLKLLKVYR